MSKQQDFPGTTTSSRLLSGIILLILASGVWAPLSSAQDNAKPSSGAVLAVVDGKEITEKDVRERASQEFARIENEYRQQQYQILESELNQMIRERLLQTDAGARGLTREQVLAEIKVADITDTDVDNFYETNKDRIQGSKEEVAGQIREYLKEMNKREAERKYYEGLEAKYKVEMKLEPLRAEVAANGPAKGPATAPVTIVEFSDFQCPFCVRVVPTLEQVRAKYGDKVRLVFRQFPLSFHPFAQKAAEASLCAHEQGKFWEMHDSMFHNQEELGVDSLKSRAQKLGLNTDQFNSCLDSSKYAPQIQADVKDGAAVGVNGTPAMFINGRLVAGAVPMEDITSVIDDELRRKGATAEP